MDNLATVLGNFIANNWQEIALGMTPAGIVLDVRDLAIAGWNFGNNPGWETGGGIALAMIAFVPGGDVGKVEQRANKLLPDSQPLFRGVPHGTEQWKLAKEGIVKPRGTSLDYSVLERHVKAENANAGVTSWTTDRSIAVKRFAREEGIVLEIKVVKVRDRIVDRPDVKQYDDESEILLKGIIYANPTKP